MPVGTQVSGDERHLFEKFEIFSPKACHFRPQSPCYDSYGNYRSFSNVDYDSWFNSKYCRIKNPGEGISNQRDQFKKFTKEVAKYVNVNQYNHKVDRIKKREAANISTYGSRLSVLN